MSSVLWQYEHLEALGGDAHITLRMRSGNTHTGTIQKLTKETVELAMTTGAARIDLACVESVHR